MTEPPPDFQRLCIHTMTTKPWSLRQAVEGYAVAGVPAVTVWRQHIDPIGISEAATILNDSGLSVAGLCRGGFFPHETTTGRQDAMDDNRRAIDEAAAIAAPLVVLVCGALPGQSLEESRKHILDGIAAVLPHAKSADVRLAIEPLHPMYADTRSAVNTIRQANEMVAALRSPHVGIAVDVYHVWWDPNLEADLAIAGSAILSFHVCDWRVPTRDLLNDRGLMGEGCVDIRQIRKWVEAAGFNGFHEVEIFSDAYWAGDQHKYLEAIKAAYKAHC